MANADRPNGAVPVMTLDGSPFNGPTRPYAVDASNATAVFRGDFVTLEADGNVTPAAAGGVLLGVVTGVKVDRSVAATEHPGYLPASTAGTVFVAVGEDVLYEMQEDGVTSTLTEADVGANIDIIAGAGSTTTGISAHELDSDTVTSAGSAQLRIVDFIDRPDNATGSTGARWLVKIHENHFGQTNGI